MFIKKSFADEIATSMERHLIDGAIDEQAAAQASIVKAADYLNAAAEIFDESGLSVQAEVVTAVLESLAAKKSKKKKLKPKSRKPAVVKKEDDKSSEAMVDNFKENGWMFGKEDSNSADDNCAACGSPRKTDSMQVDDSKEDELYALLENFKSNTSSDMDFEDEVDFDDFENRKFSPNF